MTGQEQSRRKPQAPRAPQAVTPKAQQPAYRPLAGLPGFRLDDAGKGSYWVGNRKFNARQLPGWDQAEEWMNRQRFLHASALRRFNGDAAKASQWMLDNRVEWDPQMARQYQDSMLQRGRQKAAEMGWTGLSQPGSAYERQLDAYGKWLLRGRSDPGAYYGEDDIALAASRFGGSQAFYRGFGRKGRTDLAQEAADRTRDTYGATAGLEGATDLANWGVSKLTGGKVQSVGQLAGTGTTGSARKDYAGAAEDLLLARRQEGLDRLLADPAAIKSRADAWRSKVRGMDGAALKELAAPERKALTDMGYDVSGMSDRDLMSWLAGQASDRTLAERSYSEEMASALPAAYQARMNSADLQAGGLGLLGSIFGATALPSVEALKAGGNWLKGTKAVGWLKGTKAVSKPLDLLRKGKRIAGQTLPATSPFGRFVRGGVRLVENAGKKLVTPGKITKMNPIMQATYGANMAHSAAVMAETAPQASTGIEWLDSALEKIRMGTQVGSDIAGEYMETAPAMAVGGEILGAGMKGLSAFGSYIGAKVPWLGRFGGWLKTVSGGTPKAYTKFTQWLGTKPAAVRWPVKAVTVPAAKTVGLTRAGAGKLGKATAWGVWQGGMDNVGDLSAGRTPDTNVWNYVLGPYGRVTGQFLDDYFSLQPGNRSVAFSSQAPAYMAERTADWVQGQDGAGALGIRGGRSADALQQAEDVSSGRQLSGERLSDGSFARADFSDVSDPAALRDAVRRRTGTNSWHAGLATALRNYQETGSRTVFLADLKQALGSGLELRDLTGAMGELQAVMKNLKVPKLGPDGKPLEGELLAAPGITGAEMAELTGQYAGARHRNAHGLPGLVLDSEEEIRDEALQSPEVVGAVGTTVGQYVTERVRNGGKSPYGSVAEGMEAELGAENAARLQDDPEFLRGYGEQLDRAAGTLKPDGKASAAEQVGKAVQALKGLKGNILETTVRGVSWMIPDEAVSRTVSDFVLNGGGDGKLEKLVRMLPEPARREVSRRLEQAVLGLDAKWVESLDDSQLMGLVGRFSGVDSSETLAAFGLQDSKAVADHLNGLREQVKGRVWKQVWENPLENIPKVASVWLTAKGMEGLGGFLKSPLAFWGTALALLLGLGSLLGGDDGDEEEDPRERGKGPSDGPTLLGGLESVVDTGGMI